MDALAITNYQKEISHDPSELVSLVNSQAFSEKEKMQIVSSQFEKIMLQKHIEEASKPIFLEKNSPFNIQKGHAGMFYNELLTSAFTGSNIFNLEDYFSSFNS